MVFYLLHQMKASCFTTNLMKSKLFLAETNVLGEMELRFIYDFTDQLE